MMPFLVVSLEQSISTIFTCFDFSLYSDFMTMVTIILKESVYPQQITKIKEEGGEWERERGECINRSSIMFYFLKDYYLPVCVVIEMQRFKKDYNRVE